MIKDYLKKNILYYKNFINFLKFYFFLIMYNFNFYMEHRSVFLLQYYINNLLLKNIESNRFSYKKNNKIFEKIESLYNDSTYRFPNNFLFHHYMSRAYLYTCRKEFLKCNEKMINLQNRIMEKSNKKFHVIEPGYAFLTIGSIYTIDAWIKSIKLNFCRFNKLILPTPKTLKKPVNPTLIKYLSKYIKIIKDLKESEKYLKLLKSHRCWHNHFINIKQKKIPYSHSASVYIEHIWHKKKKKPLFVLSKKDLIKGKKILKKMGVSENSWFVTSHVRDANFKSKETYRDSDITTFYKAYREIINNGGYVMRMGDKNTKDIEFNNGKFIDYAKSEFKSDFMDIFLCARAKFMLGTSSGLSAVSYVFGTPIVMVNYVPISTIYLRKGDIFIPPTFIDLKKKKNLSFKKIMSTPYSLGASENIYKNILNVELKKNDDKDIYLVVQEMINNLIFKKKYSKEDEKLQKKFKKITLSENTLLESNIPIQCRIGKDFLKKNYNLLH